MSDEIAEDDQLIPALGRISSGIYILTLGQAEQATGMLGSWVMQAGFDPPMVTVALKQGRYVSDWIVEGHPFVLNVVGAEQKHLLKHFGKGFEPGEPAFEGLETGTSSKGIVTLADAVATIECMPETHLDSEDHHIFLAEVISGNLQQESEPMTHLRKRGDHY